VNEHHAPGTLARLTPELLSLVRAIRAAKVGAGHMYAALGDRMPSFEGRLAVEQLARDEAEHAARLERLVGTDQPQLAAATSIGCGLYDEAWPSALLAAFALDQAATAALLGLSAASDAGLGDVARHIVEDERAHQAFALRAFKSVADKDPEAGRRLAAEMLVARNWVKQVFPRHTVLAALAAGGAVGPDAAQRHDSFLASLGDRMQEALGVLGD